MFWADLSMRHPMLRGKMPLLLITVIGLSLALGFVAPREPLLSIGALVVLLLGIGILAKPDLATMVVIVVLYTNAAVVAVKFHGIPEMIGSSLPALLLIPLASYLIFRRGGLVITPVLPLIFLFMAVQVVGTLLAVNIAGATTSLVNFIIEGLGLYFLITNVVRTPEMLRRAIWSLLFAGIFMGGLSFFQEVTKTYDNNYGGFAQMSNAAFGTGSEALFGSEAQRRLAGPIGEQNRYGQVMLMLVPLGFFSLWGERSRLMQILAAVATGCAALGVALTFSRGAAVGFALVIVIMTFMRYIKLWQLGVVILAVVLLFAAVPEYQYRLISLQGATSLFATDGAEAGEEQADGSMRSRVTEGLAAILVFIDHPVVGVGPGMFRYYYQEYAAYVGLRVLTADRQAHSLFPGLVAETGALGLLFFCLILYVTLRDLHRVRKRWGKTRPELANMATGFMLAVITYLTTGIFLHFAFIRYFWLIIALASAAAHIAAQLEQKEQAQNASEAAAPTPALVRRTSVPLGQE
jgi:putative inorganic carbon (HCO3(-)) transporter